MSLPDKQDISFNEISQFLARHPDFFVQHPELLQQLTIPHFSGQNVFSLLEYQVDYLQRQLRILEKDNETLNQTIESQRRLASQIHDFSLNILQSRSMNQLYNYLQKGLKKYYAADRLVMLVFGNNGTSTCYNDLRFLDSDSPLRFMFTELFHRGKPLCNSLQEEHLEALFKKGTTEIQSTVILPMADRNRQTLLVLGSFDENRYQHGTELDLLLFTSRMVNHQLSELMYC